MALSTPNRSTSAHALRENEMGDGDYECAAATAFDCACSQSRRPVATSG
jgi:hypothetical protein